jgi:hypothetical protein
MMRGKDANQSPGRRDSMKQLLGLMTGVGLSLALASVAQAGGVHVGIYLGGPPVLVPAPPPVVVVPPPQPVVVAPPVVYYPVPVVEYRQPYVLYPTRPYYVAGPPHGHGHAHKHWKKWKHWKHDD